MKFFDFLIIYVTRSFFVCTDFSTDEGGVSVAKNVKQLGLLSFKLMEQNISFTIGSVENPRTQILSSGHCPFGYSEDKEFEEKLKYKEKLFPEWLEMTILIMAVVLIALYQFLKPFVRKISENLIFSFTQNWFFTGNTRSTIVDARLEDGNVVFDYQVHIKISKTSSLLIKWTDFEGIPLNQEMPFHNFARFRTEESGKEIPHTIKHHITKESAEFSFEVDSNKITVKADEYPTCEFMPLISVYRTLETVMPMFFKMTSNEDIVKALDILYEMFSLCGCCFTSRVQGCPQKIIYLKYADEIPSEKILRLIEEKENSSNELILWAVSHGKYRYWGSSLTYGTMVFSFELVRVNYNNIVRGPEYLVSQILILIITMNCSIISHSSMIQINKLISGYKDAALDDPLIKSGFIDDILRFDDKYEFIDDVKINTDADLKTLIKNKKNYIINQSNGRPELGIIHVRSEYFAGVVLQINDKKLISPIVLLESSNFMGWLVRVKDSQVVWYFTSFIKTLDELEAAIHPDDIKQFKASVNNAKSFLQINMTFNVKIKINNVYKSYTILLYRTSGDFFVITASDVEEYLKSINELNLANSTVNLALYSGNITSLNYQNTEFPTKIFFDWNELRNSAVINISTVKSNVLEDYQEKVLNLFNNCLETGNPFMIDVPILIGTIKWCSIRGIKTGYDTIQILVIDITQTKEAEESLCLEKERVQDAVMAKTRFLADMSHEIRNPLNGISGLIELLCDANLPDKYSENIDILTSSFNQLMDLLNDTLDLAKIEQGKMIPSFTNFNALKEMEAVLSKLKKSKVPIYSGISPSLPRLLYGDPHFFRRIVSNILTNAVKFTQKGKVTYVISYDNDALTVIISDTGIGISKDIQKILFNIFSMGDSSMTRPYGGIGVGLALCKKMLSLINGSINLQSEVGVGSTFTVRFPCDAVLVPYVPKAIKEKKYQILILPKRPGIIGAAKPHADFYGIEIVEDESRITDKLRMIFISDNQEEIDHAFDIKKKYPKTEITMISNVIPTVKNAEINYIKSPIPLSTLPDIFSEIAWPKKEEISPEKKYGRVLLAEDNLTNQFVMRKMFQKLNVDCKIVDNGQEAINSLEKEKFGLVFLDENMPILDGPSAARAIRSRKEEWSNITIIALTASHSKDDETLCLDAGMNAFLTKPITLNEIKDALNKFGTK